MDKQTTMTLAPTSVTGYQRLDQLNRFVPSDIKKVLKANIGKNEMVNVSDFLMGNDYSKVENPYLPKGLQDEIRNFPALSKEIWTMTVKKMLHINNENGKNYLHISDIAYVLRYITIHPLANNNKTFVQIVINKCLDFKKTSSQTSFPQTKWLNPSNTPTSRAKINKKKIPQIIIFE